MRPRTGPGDDSDETGAFVLQGVEPGRHAIRIERLGYAPLEDSVRVEAGYVTSVTAELAREAVALEPLFVSVVRNPRLDRVGFYERKTLGERLGLGHYITREDIERRSPARVRAPAGSSPASVAARPRCPGNTARYPVPPTSS